MSIVCGTHFLLVLFLLCPMWYSGMSRLILVLIFFSRFSSALMFVQKCTAVSCVCVSALHLCYLRQVSLQSCINSLFRLASCQWIPSSSPEVHGYSPCTSVPRSPLVIVYQAFYRWGHIPSSFLVLLMWSSYFLLSFRFKGFSLVFDGGQICKW